MPDRNKFMQLKAAFDSLGAMMADYEKGFGESGEAANPFGDEDASNGGQEPPADLDPEMECCDESGTKDSKKKSMSMMSSMLKGKMKNKGY